MAIVSMRRTPRPTMAIAGGAGSAQPRAVRVAGQTAPAAAPEHRLHHAHSTPPHPSRAGGRRCLDAALSPGIVTTVGTIRPCRVRVLKVRSLITVVPPPKVVLDTTVRCRFWSHHVPVCRVRRAACASCRVAWRVRVQLRTCPWPRRRHRACARAAGPARGHAAAARCRGCSRCWARGRGWVGAFLVLRRPAWRVGGHPCTGDRHGGRAGPAGPVRAIAGARHRAPAPARRDMFYPAAEHVRMHLDDTSP
jgi:hypothetical protein